MQLFHNQYVDEALREKPIIQINGILPNNKSNILNNISKISGLAV